MPTCGTVINPRSLQGQTFGGVMLGIGHAIGQKWVYDQHYGVPLAKRFHYNQPPTILDEPIEYEVRGGRTSPIRKRRSARAASVSRRSVRVYGAILNALAAAVGDEVFRRSPVNADMILTSLEAGGARTEALTAHI